MVTKLCSKIDDCFKIKMIQDKDMLDFQFVESVKAVCKNCSDKELPQDNPDTNNTKS